MTKLSLLFLLLTIGVSAGCGSSEPEIGPEVKTSIDEGLTQEIESSGITTAEEYLRQGSVENNQ
jgi:hypothetical protein